MYYPEITKELQEELEPMIKEAFPGREYTFDLRHYYENRFVFVCTSLNDADVHYEYANGAVELHLEGKFQNPEYRFLRKALVEATLNDETFSWHRWQEHNQCMCRHDADIESASDIIKGFKYLASVFDPVFDNVGSLNEEEEEVKEEYETMSLPKSKPENIIKPKPIKIDKPAQIIKIKDLPFGDLEIPEYQRPYKWGVKNVNQLINDLQAFSGSEGTNCSPTAALEDLIWDWISTPLQESQMALARW